MNNFVAGLLLGLVLLVLCAMVFGPWIVWTLLVVSTFTIALDRVVTKLARI